MKIANPHLRGLAITAMGVLIITPDSLLVRLTDTDAWTILFYRGAFITLAICIFCAFKYGRTAPALFLAVGRVGVLAGFLAAGSNILFIVSVTLTTVANTLVIVSAAPLFAAIYSRVFLKETVELRTWIAVLVVFAGIAAIFSGSLGGGALLGDISAIGAALLFSAYLTTLRYAKNVNMVPAVALSGFFTALAVIPFAAPLLVSAHDFALLAVMGIMLPLALGLISLGPRLIPAPEVGLLILLESVLGPFWVWLAINEVPAVQTVFGGILILGTLVVHTLYMLKRETVR